jgi:type IV secretory pathway TraG/TraD family ATPase VirD4
MSAGSLLAAYRYPEVRGVARPDIRIDDFLDGGAHTLYLVASARQQRLLAPLVAGVLNAMLHGAMERPNRGSTVRVLLDEVANIAPLRDLPTYLSQAAAHEIRIATIWQSLAQLERRYGRDSDTLLANSTAKLFMGPVTDEATRKYLTHLLGDADVPTTTTTAPIGGTGGQSRTSGTKQRPAASPRDLQQLGRDRAILVNGAHVPAVVALKPWWDVAMVRRRARIDDVASRSPSFMYESSDLPIGLPLRGEARHDPATRANRTRQPRPHHGGDAQRELPFD